MPTPDKTMDGLEKAMEVINARLKETGPWDIGDKEVFVFNDAVFIVAMDEGRTLRIEGIAGPPHRHDLNLELLEKEPS